MAFSDVEKEKDKKRNVNRAIAAETNKRWSDKQKLEAVQSWLVLGNMTMVARLHGIPRITLQVWKTSAWWKELVDEIKLQEKVELSSKMKAIVDAAHLVVANRLENGDAVLNQKTGEIVYKPVSMKDAHTVAKDLLTQRSILEKTGAGDRAQEAPSDKLEKLAEKFAMFATMKIEQSLDNKRTIDVADVVDVEIKDAVHEEGPQDGEVSQGLSDRVRQVSLEAGADSQSDGPDDGPQAS